ncbi:MAG: DNA-processing protein DprA [Prevotella sp.]|nr:DNA-processing protein DprA [Prevotella sp.]
MSSQETLCTLALTRMVGFNPRVALHLYRSLGGGQAVYEQRNEVGSLIDGCTPRLLESLKHWDEAMARAEAELEFAAGHGIKVLALNDSDYPGRLRDCDDAPLAVFYKGQADLNQQRVVAIVGTRRCTSYGQDLTRRFITELKQLCPQALIVSGLAYGIDICAHRQALQSGYETVGVLAHGLDTIYPGHHRETAKAMVAQGGLLTEYMTQTEPLPNNFRQRNRIVAGLADATVVVESAARGGALITARIAQDYGRDVLAFPGAVGASGSEGCNHLIRDNKAGLMTSAEDFVNAVGWQSERQRRQAADKGIERNLFPELSADEQKVVDLLQVANDLQLNIISVRTNISIGQLTALLFQLEMKGVVKPLAGGTYHLLL